MKYLNKLRHLTITGKEKAFVGFWASGVGYYMAQNGLTVKDLWSKSALWSLLAGVITHQLIYWTQNGRSS